MTTEPNWTWRDWLQLPSGRWFHIAVVYDGNKEKTYLDGELVQEK